MTKKKKVALTLVLCLLIIGLCALFIKMKSVRHFKPAGRIYVTATTIKSRSWQPYIEEVGSLKAYQGITLKVEVAGRVTSVAFKSGDTVKAGQTLLQLDATTEAAELEYDKAELALSKATFERNAKLLNTQAVSQSDYDTALSDYKVKVAQVKEAEATLEKFTIKAPFNGRLGLSNIAVGDYLSAGDSIVLLQNLDPMFADFNVPERYLSYIKRNARVEVSSTAYPEQTFSGKVYAFSPAVDADTGMIAVRATISNKNALLLSGSLIEAKLYYDTMKNVITVPQMSIIYSSSGNYVYRIEDNKAVKTPVTVGTQIGQSIVIEKGLSIGEQIIRDGTVKVHDGSLVTVTTNHSAG